MSSSSTLVLTVPGSAGEHDVRSLVLAYGAVQLLRESPTTFHAMFETCELAQAFFEGESDLSIAGEAVALDYLPRKRRAEEAGIGTDAPLP